jgi:hypothetical protein
MGCLKGNSVPVLYIGRTVPKDCSNFYLKTQLVPDGRSRLCNGETSNLQPVTEYFCEEINKHGIVSRPLKQ